MLENCCLIPSDRFNLTDWQILRDIHAAPDSTFPYPTQLRSQSEWLIPLPDDDLMHAELAAIGFSPEFMEVWDRAIAAECWAIITQLVESVVPALKPPLGVIPRFLWEESFPHPSRSQVSDRIDALTAAIDRRGGNPEIEWLSELNYRQHSLTIPPQMTESQSQQQSQPEGCAEIDYLASTTTYTTQVFGIAIEALLDRDCRQLEGFLLVQGADVLILSTLGYPGCMLYVEGLDDDIPQTRSDLEPIWFGFSDSFQDLVLHCQRNGFAWLRICP